MIAHRPFNRRTGHFDRWMVGIADPLVASRLESDPIDSRENGTKTVRRYRPLMNCSIESVNALPGLMSASMRSCIRTWLK